MTKAAGSEKITRHAGLADGLAAIKAYLARERNADQELYGTNWRTTPDNDNAPHVRDNEGKLIEEGADHGWEVDKRMETKPSLRRIMRQVKDGDVERNDDGQIVRIGSIHFSDGEQVERGYKFGPDGRVVMADIRMPAGAMLGCKVRTDRMRGTDNRSRGDKPADEALREKHVREGNEYIAETLKAHPPRNIRGRRRRGKWPGPTHGQAVAMLAEAYANTPVLPPIKKYPPGLPWQPRELWSIFPSLVRREGKDTAMQSWQDICTATIARETWDEALSSLKAEHRAVLEVLPKARNMTDIGVAAGQSESYARSGGGIRALQAVNDNLEAALKKSAA